MTTSPRFRALVQNIAAASLGFLVIVALSIGTNLGLRKLGYSSMFMWYGLRWNLLTLGYQSLYIVIGGYLTGKVAASNAMRFALAVGALMVVLAARSAIFRFNTYDTGPVWVPVALMLAALPCASLGAFLARRKTG
jgi:hypothetical protein